ncbi:hypothetical protein EJ08DRAFT_718487, partial [Tothia fuscella]
FQGDEFNNNLFSDLDPLLTLFGEQATKQFLSMSVGWKDNILLATGPLGIITIMVSAIRVGGVRQLKALVGRAREGFATAEVEILSSTSENVCEMWNGQQIVRVIGSPWFLSKDKTTDLVMYRFTYYGDLNLLDVDVTEKMGLLDLVPLLPQRESWFLINGPPNIGWNVQGALVRKEEVWIWAVVGIMFQLIALVIPAITTYRLGWSKGNGPIPAYAYPFYLSGSSAITLGLVMCSHVIEGRTTEHTFVPSNRDEAVSIVRVLRVQPSRTINDLQINGYAILNFPGDFCVRTSRLNSKDFRQFTRTQSVIATITTLLGFFFQFVGLRALHWSATILLLGVTMIMTAIRAFIRRGLARDPICIPTHDSLPSQDKLKDSERMTSMVLDFCRYIWEPLMARRDHGRYQVYWGPLAGRFKNNTDKKNLRLLSQKCLYVSILHSTYQTHLLDVTSNSPTYNLFVPPCS